MRLGPNSTHLPWITCFSIHLPPCLLGPNCRMGLCIQLASLMTLPSDLPTLPFTLLAPQEQPGLRAPGQEVLDALLESSMLYSFFFQDLRMDLTADAPLYPESLGQQLSLASSTSLCAGGW